MMAIRPAVSAVVADLSQKERLTESYGLLRVGGNVGFAAGPAVGGYLLTFLSYTWLFGVASLTGVLTFCLILLFLRESFHGSTEKTKLHTIFSVATDRVFLMFTALSLLVFLAMGQINSTLSIFTVDRLGFSTAQYGLLLTTNGLIVVLFQYSVARWVNHLERFKGLILGSILFAIGYLSLGWIQSFGWSFTAILLITAGEIVFTPLTLSVAAELSPRDWRGRYMGFFALSQTLGISFGPMVGGILLDAFPTESQFIWGVISLIPFIAAVGLLISGFAIY